MSMRSPQLQRRASGVTLVEMLIGVAVIGIVLAVAAPSLSAFMERRRVVAAAGEVAGMFTFARAEANMIWSPVSLHIEPVPANVGDFSCIRVASTGTTDACQCSRRVDQVCLAGTSELLREYILPRSTSVRFDADPAATWSLQPYVVSFTRNKFYTTFKDVKIFVTGIKTGAKLQVEYNDAGRVRICVPAGSSMTGFPAC